MQRKITKSAQILRKNRKNEEALKETFRSIHTLKGNAGFAGLPGVYMVFHKITEFLRPFNEGRAALTIEDLNILEKISYILETSLNSIEKNETISEEKGKQLLQPLKL